MGLSRRKPLLAYRGRSYRERAGREEGKPLDEKVERYLF